MRLICEVDGMRSFSKGKSYQVVKIGKNQITLLNADGKRSTIPRQFIEKNFKVFK